MKPVWLVEFIPQARLIRLGEVAEAWRFVGAGRVVGGVAVGIGVGVGEAGGEGVGVGVGTGVTPGV